MERKRILRRAALIGLALLLAAMAVAIVAGLARPPSRERQRRLRDEHVAKLTKEFQAQLDEMAQKIKGLPVDPKAISEIQTRHYQQRPAVWLYVWASTNDGEFLFGVPSDAFARLNTVYDQHQQVIAQDNHFANRDQFLRTLLHHSRRIGPPTRDDQGRLRQKGDEDTDWWRFYSEREFEWGRIEPLFLSTPIQDSSGATVGNLNVKLLDTRVSPGRPSRGGDDLWRDIQEPALAVAVVALLWLWFLLPSWVYIDAQQRGVPRPLLWALLTLVGNVVALLVYLVSRPTDVKEFRCPQCGKTLNGSKAGCPYCGADLSAVFCAQCQYPLKLDWSFCPGCRAAVGKGPAPPREPEKG